MIKKSDSEKLQQAAALVESVIGNLNTTVGSPCDYCGLRKAEDWPEMLVSKELKSVHSKLEKLAGNFSWEGT